MKEYPKHFWQRRAVKPHPKVKSCDVVECQGWGDYRAPRRDCTADIKNDTTWHWFCLEHVRLYNAEWNFYKDMSEQDIIKHWKRDITWDRPSWPLGNWQSGVTARGLFGHNQLGKEDPFGLFKGVASANPIATRRLTTEEQDALRFFELDISFTEDELSVAYRAAVKKYHPDINANSPIAEEKMKQTTVYYKVLQKFLASDVI